MVDPLGVLTTTGYSGMQLLPSHNWHSLIMIAKEERESRSHIGSNMIGPEVRHQFYSYPIRQNLSYGLALMKGAWEMRGEHMII